VTPTWFAAVALGASIVVGFGVAYLTSRWQRQQARDDRLGDKRADAYVKLAAHAVRLRQYALVASPDLKDTDPWSPPQLDMDDLYEMFTWVEAWGSDKVLDAYDRLLTVAAQTRTAVASFAELKNLGPLGPEDRHLIEDRGDALRLMKSRKKELNELCDEALKLIRSELRTDR
jgi:hypothetical protein